VKAASETTPTLRAKHVTPHAFRHATAVHLISAGVDVTVKDDSRAIFTAVSKAQAAADWMHAQQP
jgi:integrase